ncbi:hypothetical protein MSP8886_01192 [Marinomonas spartinae]|uniref:Uncharacterized protein n=1 Tax=Marinomonas spartinae TaxID=1792290 RepID=A0A1A8T954_9GAMM|nr:hypothetical protein [Marinomonas spartinae]SBS28481.1 hypothetical protein MSP8886_01192 [Marinomonas spartinae]
MPIALIIGADSPAAEELLLGTAVQESLAFKYRNQQRGGPAVSYFQIEPNTHNDVWTNFIDYRPKLKEKVLSLLTNKSADKINELEYNDKYAAAIARIIYMRVPSPLPPIGNIEKQANYWKAHYNTPLGKGKPSEYIEKWNKYVLGVK